MIHSSGHTKLKKTDYSFLRRFIGATKANLFFARGVLMVEGPAEAILLPTLSEVCGRSFSKHGVSIVNVGHTGLYHYARILQREGGGPEYPVPAVCLTVSTQSTHLDHSAVAVSGNQVN